MTIDLHTVVPIFRIFDVAKADEFYIDFLGFKIDWEHRFDDNMPLYRQISRCGLVLHLSEHYGDGSPGVHVRIKMKGLEAYRDELKEKAYRYIKPGVEEGPVPGIREMAIIDPFGNRITFYQDHE